MALYNNTLQMEGSTCQMSAGPQVNKICGMVCCWSSVIAPNVLSHSKGAIMRCKHDRLENESSNQVPTDN